MTPHPAAAARLTLDPATADVTLATIFAALRLDPDRTPAQHQTQREAAAEMIAALQPRDPTEASYAARAVAAHYGSMECLRRAVLPDTPDNVADRLYGKALALSRMSKDMDRTLRQCQAETPRAQPQPAAQPSVPAPPPSAAASPPAAIPENPVGRQDPMSSERKSPARPAAPASQPETAAAAQRPATAAPTPPATSAQPSQAGLATEHPPAQPAARTASTATALAA
jgi:hypothetical protein